MVGPSLGDRTAHGSFHTFVNSEESGTRGPSSPRSSIVELFVTLEACL